MNDAGTELHYIGEVRLYFIIDDYNVPDHASSTYLMPFSFIAN
jgi:hypothetical protein